MEQRNNLNLNISEALIYTQIRQKKEQKSTSIVPDDVTYYVPEVRVHKWVPPQGVARPEPIDYRTYNLCEAYYIPLSKRGRIHRRWWRIKLKIKKKDGK